LQEYLSSHDLAEARRCLTELDVPHFHHELVYDAIVYALEGNDAQVQCDMHGCADNELAIHGAPESMFAAFSIGLSSASACWNCCNTSASRSP